VRRTVAAAAAVAILLVLAGSIYLLGQTPATSSQTSSTASTNAPNSTLSSVSSSSSLSTSSSVSASTSSMITTANSGAASGDWVTYHRDNSRTGYLPVSNFTSATREWTSSSLDGSVYAEPLVFGGHVFVATENNSVYSLDATTCNVTWRTNLGPPVDGSQLPCGDINPTGITGTPVIDPSTGTLFVVSYSAFHHALTALKTSTGSIVFQRLAVPPGFTEVPQQERAALSLANGMVYVPYGGLAGDCAQYYGWVVGIPANGTGSMAVYKVPTSREGGIWTPSGAAVDPAGKVYITTGNAASDTTFDYGNSVIRLSATLSVEGYFAPTNWAQLSDGDVDVGSVGPAFVAPGVLFQIGKEGVGYLLNADKLGGVGGQTFKASVCGGAFGGTAYASSLVFVPCRDGLVALQVANGAFTTAWRTSSYFAGPPVVTGGIVWTVDRDSAALLGYSTSTGHQAYSFPLGSVVHFCGPAAGDGRVFVTSGDKVVSFLLG
jgi:outer membrane protein assembly factor BamB